MRWRIGDKQRYLLSIVIPSSSEYVRKSIALGFRSIPAASSLQAVQIVEEGIDVVGEGIKFRDERGVLRWVVPENHKAKAKGIRSNLPGGNEGLTDGVDVVLGFLDVRALTSCYVLDEEDVTGELSVSRVGHQGSCYSQSLPGRRRRVIGQFFEYVALVGTRRLKYR